jgi:hypothetical protein
MMETAFDDPANDHCGHDQRFSGAAGHFDLYLRLNHRKVARALSHFASRDFATPGQRPTSIDEVSRWH